MVKRKLTPGEAYFLLLFGDEEPPIPVIQTLIFDKEAATDSGEPILLFRYIPPDESEERRWFLPAGEIDHVLSLGQLSERLAQLSSRASPFA